jgi:hypothetical protein
MNAKLDGRSKEARDASAAKDKSDLAVAMAELAKVKAELEATKFARTDTQRTEMSTVRREEHVKLTDGPALNMAVWGEIPGYSMYKAVDQDGEVERLLHVGYEFVRFGEVPTNASKGFDASADDRISWHSGTDEGGRSYRTYLMKMAIERYQERVATRDAVEERNTAELKGRVIANGEGRYQPTRGLNIIN